MFRNVLVGAPVRKLISVLPWLILSGALFGQGNSGNAPGGGPANNGNRVALPQDWSDHSVVFSQPADQQKGSQPSQDPRYWKQVIGRNMAGTRSANVTNPAAPNRGNGSGKKNPPPPPRPGTPQGDWNYSLGPSSSSHVAANMFPAQYNFDINQAPSCTQDFVVFAENATGKLALTASQTGTFSGSNGTGNVAVDGTTLSASAGTAASKTGTFTAQPSAGAVTITNGSTRTVTNGGTAKTVTGTFSGGPVLTADSITLTTGGNGLVLKAGGTAPSVVGTFSGQPTSGSIAINYNNTKTVMLLTKGATAAHVTGTFAGSFTGGTAGVTVNGTTATFTDGVATGSGSFSGNICIGTGQGVTINGVNLTTNGTLPTGGKVDWTGSNPDSSAQLTITGPAGTQVYTFVSSLSASNDVLIGSTTALTASNLTAAINANSGQCGSTAPCFGTGTTSNPNVSASVSTALVNLTAKCTSASAGYSLSQTNGPGKKVNATLTPFGGGSAGSNTGSSFAVSTTATTMATNLVSAINANAGTGVTATNGGGTSATVSLTASTPGSAGNVSFSQNMTSGFSWSGAALTGGNDSNACTSATSGNFVNSSTSTTAASNFKTALDSCISQGFPATDSLSGSAVTVTSTAVGSSVTITDSDSLGNFSWGTITNGADGSNVCFNSTTGTFANSTSTTTLASNLATAINNCNTSFPAVGLTATSSTNTTTVTAAAKGSAITLDTTGTDANNFSWGSVSAGTDGSNRSEE